jgi:hypothetical protein
VSVPFFLRKPDVGDLGVTPVLQIVTVEPAQGMTGFGRVVYTLSVEDITAHAHDPFPHARQPVIIHQGEGHLREVPQRVHIADGWVTLSRDWRLPLLWTGMSVAAAVITSWLNVTAENGGTRGGTCPPCRTQDRPVTVI